MPKTGQKNSARTIKILLLIIVFSFAYVFLNMPDDSPSSSIPTARGNQYEAKWHKEFHSGITKALAAKNIRGCGEYKYKASLTENNEYLVHCTRDGEKWFEYLVWPRITEVTGPFLPGVN